MEKKEVLIKEITPLFLEHGYWNVRVDDIAKELKISKKTLYVYFENKKEIIWEVIQNKFETIQSIAEISEETNENAIRALFTIFSKFYSYLGVEQDRKNLEELQRYYPEIYIKHQDDITTLIQKIIVNNYKRGIEEGLYTTAFEPTYVAHFMSNSYVANRLINHQNELFALDKIKDTTIKIIVGGIVTDKGRALFQQYREPVI